MSSLKPKPRPVFIFLLTIVLLSLDLPARADFSISGTLSQLDQGTKLQLLRQDLDTRNQINEGELAVQSNHSFEKVFNIEPGLFNLEIPGLGTIPLALADGEHVVIIANPNNSNSFSVSGSPATDILMAYEAFRKESLARLVYPPRAKLNEATADRLSPEEMAPMAQAEVDGYNAHRRELNDFTIGHVGSSMALYATSPRWDGDYRLEELREQVATFAKKHPDLAITRSMRERLRLFGITAVGARATPLSGTSLGGKTISLEDFKGKVVLVDFWASWCGPCRVENRHYPKLLEKYSKSGFEIFGINLDDDRTVWAGASKQDMVSWPQVSDLRGLDSPMAKAYNVSALPVSFLLDREGRILAKNLRGQGLARKLEELFGK